MLEIRASKKATIPLKQSPMNPKSMPLGLIKHGSPNGPLAPKAYNFEPEKPAIAPPIPADKKLEIITFLRGIKTP